MGARARSKGDILSGCRTPLLVYALPTAAILAAGYGGASRTTVTSVWTAAFLIMGVACLANALGCGRVHCWFTGPFFLLMALAALLYGLHVLPLGPGGWQSLGNVFLVGAVVLYFVPEWIWGRYFARRS
jgi:hypothetical protein